jgi:hypothetical protein
MLPGITGSGITRYLYLPPDAGCRSRRRLASTPTLHGFWMASGKLRTGRITTVVPDFHVAFTGQRTGAQEKGKMMIQFYCELPFWGEGEEMTI